MTLYSNLSSGELENLQEVLEQKYQKYAEENLKLDMTRGKPSPQQLDLAMGLLNLPAAGDMIVDGNVDIRNYGGLDGFNAAKTLFADYLGTTPSELIIGGNSSLNMMFDAMARALIFGVPESHRPWVKEERIRFIAPTPGYDRHFTICEHLGIEMIPVDLLTDGPDMDQVEGLVANDPLIKGIWCVPKYSNPTGTIYSDKTVRRLATMKTAADDFRIFCDNAYAVHFFEKGPDPLYNFLTACKKAGNPNRVLMFGSTSKITFAGSGVAMLGASEINIADAKKHMSAQTIGPDKVNIARHLNFFKNKEGILQHMEKHAAIMKPKFDAIQKILSRDLSGKGIAEWTHPRGGYFVSLDTLDGCAKKVVAMAKKIGVTLTEAGATFPYKNDPRDRNIRIAPSLPPLVEVEKAMERVSICIELAAVRKYLGLNKAS